MAIKSKKVRYTARQRTKIRIRRRIQSSTDRPRISVFRSSKHIYAQLIDGLGGQTIVSASTVEKAAQDKLKTLKPAEGASTTKSSKGVNAARAVGLLLAERCKEKNVTQVVFDRNGFVYHGRIKALADGAREGGLEF